MAAFVVGLLALAYLTVSQSSAASRARGGIVAVSTQGTIVSETPTGQHRHKIYRPADPRLNLGDVAASTNGKRIAAYVWGNLSSGPGHGRDVTKILLMNGDGSHVRLLRNFRGAALVDGIDISDNGRYVVYSKGGSGGVATYVLNVKSGSQHRIGPSDPQDVAFSHDSKKIAFVRQSQIFVARASGGGAHRVTSGHGLDSYPTFSPDDKTLAYSSFRGADRSAEHVWLLNLRTGHERQLTRGTRSQSAPCFSPTGRALVYYTQPGRTAAGSGLHTIRASGTHDKLLDRHAHAADWTRANG